MSKWSSGEVSLNGGRVHYHRTGGDRPPLVLLHGFSDAGLCWTRLARDLEQDYDLVLPDAPGHGLSEVAASGTSSGRSYVAGLIGALELGRPALMGHSMGAVMASAVAADAPDLVASAVLEDPPWFAEEAPTPSPGRWDSLRQSKGMSRDELIALCRDENPSWADEEVEHWAEAKLQFDLALLDSSRQGPRPAWRPIVSRIQCPLLLVAADPERGAIVTPEVAQEAVRLTANGRVTHIGGAGHSIHREQYGRFREAVVGFLRETYS